MQYNKKQFRKSNDKKIMKKVKKHWVVASIASFAFFGASVFASSSMNVKADDKDSNNVIQYEPNNNQNSNNTENISSKNQNGDQSNSNEVTFNPRQRQPISSAQLQQSNLTSMQGAQTNPSTQNKVYTNAVQQNQSTSNNDKGIKDWQNGVKDNTNTSSDYNNAYNSASQGFKDSMNSDKNIVQSQNKNNTNNPASNNNKINSNYQSGVNQYNNYRDVMNSGASDAYNGKGDNSSLQTDTSSKNYYEAAYNGANNAKSDYNNVTQNEGTSNQDYTNYQQWLADNNKSQNDTPQQNRDNVKSYSDYLNDKFNSKGNVSVHTSNSAVVQVAKPDDNAIVSQQNQYNQQQNYNNNSGYALAYQYGINYFLANKGAEDAKAGKWNGTNGSNTMKSFYQPSSGSTNPYDQAYLGAQAAVNKQISQTQSGTNTTVNNYSGTNNSAYYQSGYNDAANQTQNGTVYIGNAVQMDNVFKNDMANVNSLKLVNDIAYMNYDKFALTAVKNINSTNLDIDGQNHMLDQTDTNYTFWPNNPNTKLNIHNFQTIYGASYYGPFAFDNTGNDNNANTYSITYSNINYIGSKLVSSYYSDVYVNGSVNQDDVDTYTSPFNSMATQTDNIYGNGGNYQPGVQINNMILGAGAKYFVNTAQQTGGTTLQIRGNLTLGQNSTMTLMPTGAAQGQNSPDNVNNYGIDIQNADSSLNVNKGATLNVYPETKYGQYVSGIHSNGNININGGTINAEAYGEFANGKNVLIYSNGSIDVLNGGNLNVKVAGTNNNSAGLINNNSVMNINSGGTLTVDGSNTNGVVNLINGNQLNVYDVGNRNVNLLRNSNNNSSFSTAGINGYTVRAYTDPAKPNDTWYYDFNMDSSGNYTGTDQNGKKTTGNINTQSLYIAAVPSAYFVGPIYVTKNLSGNTVINGYARVAQYSSTAGPVYIQYVAGNSDGQSIPQYTDMQTIGNPSIGNSFSSLDKDKYNQQVQINGKNDLIPISFTLPAGSPSYNTYGVRLRYGVSGVNEVIANNKYTSSVEGRNQTSDGNLSENNSVLSAGSIDSSNQGTDNALDDLSNQTSDKSSTMYQKDPDYTNAYDSVTAGYNLYGKNPNLGLNDQSNVNSILQNLQASNYDVVNGSFNNIADPSSFIKGYARAKADAQGYIDGANAFDKNGYNQADNSQTNSYKNNYNQAFTFAMNGFQNALDGNKNLPNPNAGDNDPENIAYNAGYNEETNAMNGSKLAAQNQNASVNGQANSYQAGFNAYNQALNDYNTKHQASDVSSQPPLYQKMYNYQFNGICNDVAKGVQDAQNNPNQGDAYNGSPAQKQAYAATVAGNNAQANNSPKPSDFDKQSPIYQNAYNNAYNQAQQAQKNGAALTPGQQAAINNNNNNNQNASSDAAQANPANDSKYQGNSNADMTYQGAKDGYANGGNGSMDTTKTSNQNYVNAFNVAQAKAKTAASNGANQFLSGQNNKPTESTPAEQSADQYGYQQAQKGYNANPVDQSNTDPSYRAGVKAAQDKNTGAQYAQQHPTQGINYQGQNQNQIDAYNATVDGSKAGASGITKPDLSKQSRVYQDAYNSAYQHANDIANRAAAGQLNENNLITPLDRNSFAQGTSDAQNGYNIALENNPTTNDSKYNGTSNIDKAYQGARDGFTDGTTPNSSPKSNDPVYLNEYNRAKNDAAKAANTGAQEFAQGNDKGSSSTSSSNDALSAAQNKGFEQAQTGYRNQIANDVDGNNKNVNYAQGVQAAKDVQSGQELAKTDLSTGLEHPSSIAQSQSFNGSKDGTMDGASGKPMNPKENNDFYNSSYQKAYKNAQYLAQQGAEGNPVDQNKLNNDKMASEAYSQGVNDYNNAYQQALSQNTPDNDGQHTGDSNYDQAYNGSIDGFKAGNNPKSQPTSSNPVYMRAYNQAQQNASRAVTDGINEFKAGKSQTEVSDKNDPVSEAQNTAFNQAKAGYNANPVDSTNKNPGYLAGIQMAKDKNQGISDAQNANQPDPNYQGSDEQKQAYNATFAGIKAAMNGQAQPDLSNQPKVYQDAYNQAYQQAKANADKIAQGNTPTDLTPAQKQANADAQQAITNAANAANDNNPANDAKYAGNTNADQAYQGAKAGLANGGTGKMDPSKANNPYYKNAFDNAQRQAQQAAQNGANQYVNGETNNPTESNNAGKAADNYGYQQAQKGYQAQMNGTADSQNNDPSYQAGIKMANAANQGASDANNASQPDASYNGSPAQKQAYQATFDGTQAAMNGQPIPSDLNKQSQAYQDAYNKAYNDTDQKAKANATDIIDDKIPADLSNAQQQAAHQASKVMNDAIKAADANNPDNDAQYSGNTNADKAYQGAKDGYANNGNNTIDPTKAKDPYYKSAYDKANNDARQAAQAGLNEFRNGRENSSSQGRNDAINNAHNDGYNSAQDGYNEQRKNQVDPSNNDPSYQAGVQMAIDEANGANDAQNSEHPKKDYQGSYDQKQAYQATYDGIAAGANSAPKPSDLNTKSRTYQDAYNAAYNQAQASANALANGGPNTNLSPAEKTVITDANTNVDQAKKAANENNPSNDDKYNGNTNSDMAYQGIKDGYANGGNNQINPNKANNPFYRNAFNDAQQKAKAAVQNGLNQFTNGDSNTPNEGTPAEQAASRNAYNDAQNMYQQTMNGANNIDHNNLTPAQKAGYDKAKNVLSGLSDNINGKQPENNDKNYMNGYNTAKTAMDNAINDARNGKHTSNVPSGLNPDIYNNIYKEAQAAYNDGISGKASNPNTNNAIDKSVYSHAYKMGQNDIVIPSSNNDLHANTVNKPNINHNKANKGFNTQDFYLGEMNALRNIKNAKVSSSSYNDGYRNGLLGLSGMRDAANKSLMKKFSNKQDKASYDDGYSGYKHGIAAAKRTMKANKRLSKHDLAGKNAIYVHAFKQGMKVEQRHQHNLGIKRGIEKAKSMHAVPTNLNITHSLTYAKSYMSAYKREMKRKMPKYVYNVRKIFTHSNVKFTRSDRIKEYVRKPRYDSNIFKVVGIEYYKNGTPRYRVRGGGIVSKSGTGVIAADNSVVNVYYQHNFKQIRVIKPKGALVHTGKKFSKNNVARRAYHGEIFNVDKVVNYKGLTRFYIGHGEYVTANKTYVGKVK
ncbi:DUF5776 domain-containing protein [Apilactobacillus apisilvae]|uniref:DUF5776 domain-containing protein n=1 Tax=Apilactobacillus apisilvae TaxID=2923364 RepID=A0ABY4PGQ9_9LACO|nr:DUF5776 domain-containing protein [Apilactobacillus apisilvae]UQS84929.1 DUF5776 domain-containing protein [Apilactobacillus apisilvae]